MKLFTVINILLEDIYIVTRGIISMILINYIINNIIMEKYVVIMICIFLSIWVFIPGLQKIYSLIESDIK